MEKKINVAELLKDCPQGMELDCVLFNKTVKFDGLDKASSLYPIRVKIEDNIEWFDEYGYYNAKKPYSKCVIFPKGKTTWEGFVPPCKFKDGDILYIKAAFDWICIYKEIEYTENVYNYVAVLMQSNATNLFRDECCLCCREDISEIRLATEEEKQKLFKAIKDYGYKWNAETKTLEELVTNKFDITTLKAFESRVLVRDYDNQIWIPTFWGKYLEDDSNCRYLTTNGCYKYCIPYEHNQHLLGTTDDCDDYFKIWE